MSDILRRAWAAVRSIPHNLRRIPVGVRANIYRGLGVVVPALVTAGKMTADDAELTLEVAALVLGVGGIALAAVNTPRDGRPQ